MADQYFPSVSDEASIYGTVSHVDVTGAGVRAMLAQDPQLAQRASDITSAAPNLTPGTVYSLAKQGLSPDHPVVQQLAAEQHRQDVSAGAIAKGAVRVGTTALASPYQEVTGLQRDALILGERGGGQLGKQTGGLAAGAATGAAAGATIGGILGAPIFGLGEVVTAPAGALVGGILGGLAGFFGSRDVKVKENARITWASSGAKALGALAQGRDVNLGSGFLPGGRINDEVMRQASGVDLNGQPITGGRLIFHDIGDPSVAGHHILSGLVDAASMSKLDPANFALEGLGERIKQAQHFVPAADTAAGRAAGLIGGAATKATLPELADRWLKGSSAATVGKAIAEEGSAYTIWKDAFARKVPWEVASDLSKINDPTDVLAYLRGKIIDGSVYDKPSFGTMRDSVRNVLSHGPFSPDVMPNGGRVSLGTAQERAQGLDSYLTALQGGPANSWWKGGKLTADQVERHVSDFAGAASREGQYKALTATMADIARNLAGNGVDEGKIREMTRIWNDGLSSSLYGVDDVGANMRAFSLKVDGHNINLPDPQLEAEHLGSQVTLPDVRLLRRSLSAWEPVLNNKAIDISRSALENITKAWSLTHVASIATSLRIMAETQMGFAARGLDSFFSHPINTLAWASGASDLEGGVSSRIAGVVGEKGGFNALGDVAEHAGNTHGDLMSAASIVDPVGSTRMVGKDLIPRTQPASRFLDGWHQEIEALSRDSIASHLAANGAAATKAAIADGALTSVAKRLGRSELTTPQGISNYVDGLSERLALKTGGDERLLDYIATRRQADRAMGPADEGMEGSASAGIAKVLGEMYDKGAGPKFVTADKLINDPANRAGLVKQAADWWMTHVFSQPQNYLASGPAYSQLYWKRVGQLFREMTPEAQDTVRAAAEKANTLETLQDVGRSNSGVLSAITDESGSPIRVYHGTIHDFEKFDPAMAAKNQVEVEFGRNTGYYFSKNPGVANDYVVMRGGSRDAFGRIRGTPQVKTAYLDIRNPYHPTFGGPYTPEFVADLRAKGYDGIDYHKASTLAPEHDASEVVAFDASQIHSTPDTLPKAGLTAEHVDQIAAAHAGTEYLKIVHDVTNRGQFADQVRLLSPFIDAHIKLVKRWSSALYENPQLLRTADKGISEANQDGFFHSDSQGLRMFSFPLGSMATKSVLGIPVGLEGDPSRPLSFVSSSVLPGVGPVVSIPASMLIPDQPGAADTIRTLAGASHGLGKGVGQTIDSELPSWAQGALSAVGDVGFDRQHANMVKESVRYLTSTGRYDLTTPEGQTALRGAASWRATGLGILQAIGKFVSPTGMTEVPLTKFKDDQGRNFTAQALSDEYYRMVKAAGDSAKGTQDFLSRYGPDAVGYIQGMSSDGIAGAPTTTEGGDWVRAHPDLRGDLPRTFALFAPVGGKFDPSVVTSQYDNADRVNLTPEQFTRAMASRLAGWQYAQAKDDLMVNGKMTSANQKILNQLHDALIAAYPGFGDPLPSPRTPFKVLLPELQDAITNPTVMATDAGKGLALYLDLRDTLAAAAKSGGHGNWATASSTVNLRDMARTAATAIINVYPGFENVWQNALQRELKNDG